MFDRAIKRKRALQAHYLPLILEADTWLQTTLENPSDTIIRERHDALLLDARRSNLIQVNDAPYLVEVIRTEPRNPI